MLISEKIFGDLKFTLTIVVRTEILLAQQSSTAISIFKLKLNVIPLK